LIFQTFRHFAAILIAIIDYWYWWFSLFSPLIFSILFRHYFRRHFITIFHFHDTFIDYATPLFHCHDWFALSQRH
jgi:hypothetical protein